MSTLTGSVGANGRNARSDVLLIQGLLKSKGCDPGPVDGVCGSHTISAIRKFQATFLPSPDGLVEPNRTTWHRLLQQIGPIALGLAQWNGDSALWSQDKKIASMNPLLRPKVKAVLAALAGSGFKPQVYYGWRSVAVQLKLYQEGNS